jgi:hypothetical protein
MDSISPLPFRGFEAEPIFIDPKPSPPSRPFNGKASIIVSIARFGRHIVYIALTPRFSNRKSIFLPSNREKVEK